MSPAISQYSAAPDDDDGVEIERMPSRRVQFSEVIDRSDKSVEWTVPFGRRATVFGFDEEVVTPPRRGTVMGFGDNSQFGYDKPPEYEDRDSDDEAFEQATVAAAKFHGFGGFEQQVMENVAVARTSVSFLFIILDMGLSTRPTNLITQICLMPIN